MSLVILSQFLESTKNDLLNPNVASNIQIFTNGYQVGQLCVHEWYEKNLTEKKFSYMKETAIITDVKYHKKRSDEKNVVKYYDKSNYIEYHNSDVTIISLNSVSSIDYSSKLIYHKKFGQTLISFDDGKSWKTAVMELNASGEIINLDELFLAKGRCENIKLININEVVQRYYVNSNELRESGGRYHDSPAILPYREPPSWCAV